MAKQKQSDITMVIVGSTGSGKSSTGNSILRQRVFRVSHGVARGTSKLQTVTTFIKTKSVKVVDTPDICYAGLAEETDQDLLLQRQTVVGLCREADAVLLTIPSDCRYTEEEDKVYQTLMADLGSQLTDKLVVVFTKADLYPIKNYLFNFDDDDDNPRLKRVLDDARNRHVLINNRSSFARIQESVKQLLDAVYGLLAEKEEKQQVKRAWSPIKSPRGKHIKSEEAAEKEKKQQAKRAGSPIKSPRGLYTLLGQTGKKKIRKSRKIWPDHTK